MPDDLGNAVNQLRKARQAARKTAAELLEKERAARRRRQTQAAQRYAAAHSDAINAEDEATRLLEEGLVNPTGEKVRSLADATDELNDRLEELRADEAAFNDVANAISALSDAISIFRIF